MTHDTWQLEGVMTPWHPVTISWHDKNKTNLVFNSTKDECRVFYPEYAEVWRYARAKWGLIVRHRVKFPISQSPLKTWNVTQDASHLWRAPVQGSENLTFCDGGGPSLNISSHDKMTTSVKWELGSTRSPAAWSSPSHVLFVIRWSSLWTRHSPSAAQNCSVRPVSDPPGNYIRGMFAIWKLWITKILGSQWWRWKVVNGRLISI